MKKFILLMIAMLLVFGLIGFITYRVTEPRLHVYQSSMEE